MRVRLRGRAVVCGRQTDRVSGKQVDDFPGAKNTVRTGAAAWCGRGLVPRPRTCPTSVSVALPAPMACPTILLNAPSVP